MRPLIYSLKYLFPIMLVAVVVFLALCEIGDIINKKPNYKPIYGGQQGIVYDTTIWRAYTLVEHNWVNVLDGNIVTVKFIKKP